MRLAFAPEERASSFGGDLDNFSFPRFALDAAFLRLYENDRPVATETHFTWNADAPTPGEAVRDFWSSKSAAVEGSNNLAGIADPVIDELTNRMLKAGTREEMLTFAHALDRVMRLGHFWVPQWYSGSHHTAYWDIFGMPETMPRYDFDVARTWWSKEA